MLLQFFSTEWKQVLVNRSGLALFSGSTKTLDTGWPDGLMHPLFMLLSDLIALCVCMCCVCVTQNFKGLRQGCVIPFKETEAVKTVLP